ncbi:MAG: hypothetical protein HY901_05920, partial [Deltaproteobacteria bacterium]|nr:hypothetical protein [Deltaproteobacteria bacterium]
IGRCVEGCTTESFDVPGCSVAYACKTWSRIAPGTQCTTTADCEPGQVEGRPSNTLVCESARCVDAASQKWASVPTPLICGDSGRMSFGHPECNGAPCLGQDDYATTAWCSAARCIVDSDCPFAWHCRCAEESSGSGLRAWRWCVPDEVPAADAGS